jgi:hypothetical protein
VRPQGKTKLGFFPLPVVEAGLQTIDEDDDMLSAMARDLVEKNGIGESADAIWKSLSEEHQKLFPATKVENPESAHDASEEEKSEAAALVEAAITSQPSLVFGQDPQQLETARRRPRHDVPEQGLLFNWN